MLRWQRSIQPAHFVDLSVNLEDPISNLLSAKVWTHLGSCEQRCSRRRLKGAISGAPARILKGGSYAYRLSASVCLGEVLHSGSMVIPPRY